MNVVHRHRCHILHLARSVGQLTNVGHQGAVGSAHDGGNTQIRPGVATVRVEATNSTTTARLKEAAQGCNHYPFANYFSQRIAKTDDYLAWFKAIGKLYLLPSEARSRFVIRSGRICAGYGYAISWLICSTYSHLIQCQCQHYVGTDANVCTTTDDDIDSESHTAVDAQYLSDPQPPNARVADTQWQVRTTQQYTTKEDDDASGPEETVSRGAMLGTYSGDDDDKEEVYQPAPPDTPLDAISILRRNPLHDYRPPLCGTHSPQQHYCHR
ncbi:hypothetical protein Gotur_008327 [Gossypium turneri]